MWLMMNAIEQWMFVKPLVMTRTLTHFLILCSGDSNKLRRLESAHLRITLGFLQVPCFWQPDRNERKWGINRWNEGIDVCAGTEMKREEWEREVGPVCPLPPLTTPSQVTCMSLITTRCPFVYTHTLAVKKVVLIDTHRYRRHPCLWERSRTHTVHTMFVKAQRYLIYFVALRFSEGWTGHLAGHLLVGPTLQLSYFLLTGK